MQKSGLATCTCIPLSNLTADNMPSNEAKLKWSCYNKFGMDWLDRVKRKGKEDAIKSKCGDESSTKRICPQC